MANSSLVNFLSYLTLAIIAFLYPFILTCSCYAFHKYHHKPYFIHRNKPLTIAMVCGLTCLMFIYALPALLTVQFNITLIKNELHNETLLILIGFGLLIACWILFALRTFDLAIKIIYTQQTKQWKLLLNPNHFKNNFVFDHYHTLSNPKYQLLT
eukprot:74376_1